MIPILFAANTDPTALQDVNKIPLEDVSGELLMVNEVGAARTFTSHGIGDLSDAISCFVEEERNGAYELEMDYPIDGIHFSELAQRALIVAKPNFTDDPQPFRIYRITKPISGVCTIYAAHISYDMSGIAVEPFTASTIPTALAGLKTHALNDCPFTLSSSRSTAAGFTVDQTSSMRSWLGGKEGSLLDVYGGEWHYDKYRATLENSRGMDRGVVINYGRNLTDLEQEEDSSGAYTGCVAVYIDIDTGEETRGAIQYVTGRAYDKVYVLDCSGDYDSAPSVAQLNAKASAYLANNDLAAPSFNITLDFIQSDKLPDRVDLCDTVKIYFEELGVSATAKCIRTKWNVLLDRYEETEFGDSQTNIADTIYEAQKDVSGIPTLSELEQAVTRATNRITGNLGGYVVMNDSDADGYPDEILVMDQPSTDTAVKVWRWNNSGLGYSGTGYAGPYGLAMTIDGEIVADYVTSGQLDAAVIKAGILQDRAGRNYWNMVTGEFSIQGGSENVGNFKTYYAETAKDSAPQWDITGELYEHDGEELYDKNGVVLMAEPVYSTTVPVNTDPTYKWMRTYVEYTDGTSSVTSGAPLFDYYGRSQLVIKTMDDGNGQTKGYMSALADYIEMTAGQLRIYSPQFTLDESGNATFSGELRAASGTFSGELRAATGSFSGAVNATSLTLGSGVAVGSTPASGATGFEVSPAGLLQASNAIIWGTIYATAGTIGGLTLSSNSIKSSNNAFSVSSTGAVTASNLTLTGGTIDAGAVDVINFDASIISSGTISSSRIANNSITSGKLASDVTSAITAAQSAADGANRREHTIYISKPSGTTSVTAPTAWVTSTSNSQNTWTASRPVYSSSYPVLFVATQRQTVGGTVTCTTPVIDQTTTVIDGGHITTGTIDAGVVNVTNINASNITSGTITGRAINNGNGTFKVDSSGNVTANSFTSSSATITGGSINMTSVGSAYRAITLSTNLVSGVTVNITPLKMDYISSGNQATEILGGMVMMGPVTRSSDGSVGTITPTITMNSGSGYVICVAVQQTSDGRLKEVIPKEVPDLSSVRAVRFKWRDEHRGLAERVGYIAQDVEKIAPEFVSEDKDGTKSLDYIEVLVAKVERLEKKLEELTHG